MRTAPLLPPPSRIHALLRAASANARPAASMVLGWLALRSASSWAHDGHGMAATSHWHASDTLGLLVGAVAVTAVWLWKGKP